MFRRNRSAHAASPDKVYSEALRAMGHGRALLHPEPHATGEVQLGDVGYIIGGAFVRLLNTDTAAQWKQVTAWSPAYKKDGPGDAQAPELQVDRRAHPWHPMVYHSYGMESVSLHNGEELISYAYTEGQGAALELKSEAHSEALYSDRALERYILQEYGRWVAYGHAVAREPLSRAMRVDITQRPLVFVAGTVKTTADWRITVVQTGRSGHGDNWSLSREGLHYAKRPLAGMRPNQCIFVECYSVVRQGGLLRRLVKDVPDSAKEEKKVVDRAPVVEVYKDDEPDPIEVLQSFITNAFTDSNY